MFTRPGRHVIALSPDGTSLVYVANEQLYLRKMGELTAVPIAGTEKSNPGEPIFSPDGQWVAFYSDPELKKVPITGGTPVTLAAVGNPFGGSWIGDRILVGQASPRGIVEVPASGGTAKLLVGVDESKTELAHGPQLIAGGRAVLFSIRTGAQPWDDAVVVVHELATGRRTALVNGGTDARVLPTGHLAYVREATLFAMPFDEERLMVSGGPVPVQPGIQEAFVNASGATQAAWSDSGAMAFVPGGAAAFERALVWLTREGQQEPTTAPQRRFVIGGSGLALSPDGTQAAVSVNDGARAVGTDIWVWTIARGALTRTADRGPPADQGGVWRGYSEDLARRPLDRVQLERIWTHRGVCAAIPPRWIRGDGRCRPRRASSRAGRRTGASCSLAGVGTEVPCRAGRVRSSQGRPSPLASRRKSRRHRLRLTRILPTTSRPMGVFLPTWPHPGVPPQRHRGLRLWWCNTGSTS